MNNILFLNLISLINLLLNIRTLLNTYNPFITLKTLFLISLKIFI
jgi:hypothetical protein